MTPLRNPKAGKQKCKAAGAPLMSRHITIPAFGTPGKDGVSASPGTRRSEREARLKNLLKVALMLPASSDAPRLRLTVKAGGLFILKGNNNSGNVPRRSPSRRRCGFNWEAVGGRRSPSLIGNFNQPDRTRFSASRSNRVALVEATWTRWW